MGLITKTVNVRVHPSSKRYEDLGYEIPKKKASESYRQTHHIDYVYDYSKTIEVKVEDLAPSSQALLDIICDYCGNPYQTTYYTYRRCVDENGKCACHRCAHAKAEPTVIQKYGARSPLANPEIKQKTNKTLMKKYGTTNIRDVDEINQKRNQTINDRYGVDNVSKNESIKKKKEQTLLLHYGVKNPNQSIEIKNRIMQTNRDRYGGNGPTSSQIVRQKVAKSFNDNCTKPTSRQQKYINTLYNGELNGNIIAYNCDVVLRDEKIYVEYQGGGHNLSVKLGHVSQDEFNLYETRRRIIIQRAGFKRVEIISVKDKIPSDTILLQMLDDARTFFRNNPERSWCTFDIDKGVFLNKLNKDSGGDPYDYGPLRKIKKSDIKEEEFQSSSSIFLKGDKRCW